MRPRANAEADKPLTSAVTSHATRKMAPRADRIFTLSQFGTFSDCGLSGPYTIANRRCMIGIRVDVPRRTRTRTASDWDVTNRLVRRVQRTSGHY